MSFQRLNINTKKSLPGLYTCDYPPSCHLHKRTAGQHGSLLHSDVEGYNLEDFGAKLERCKGSPSKDVGSKRKKLFGSLRSLRSLATLYPSPRKARPDDTKHVESPVKKTDRSKTQLPESPSLALLGFEQSPSDKPMFDLRLHERFVSGSSLEVQHSSPVTVPGSTRQVTPYGIAASGTDLPSGTIPDTPGPMQRAFDRDLTNQTSRRNASPVFFERSTPSTPILTPLPGTNLSVGDIDPELVPLPPSLNPSAVQIGQGAPGYFGIPVDERLHMGDVDMLNGLNCLKLAGDHRNSHSKENGNLTDTEAQAQIGNVSSTKFASENAKLPNAANTLCFSQDRVRTLRRNQQAEAVGNVVRALNIPQQNYALPFRPKQSEEDPQVQARKDSIVSEDWETSSGKHSVDTASEKTHECPNQPGFTGNSANSTTSAFVQDRERRMSGRVSPVELTYVVWNSPEETTLNTAKNNTWAGHPGLYDGSGYGKEENGPATPVEPDEGTRDVHLQANPHLDEAPPVCLSALGGRPRERLSGGAARTEDAYSERVQGRLPLRDDEQHDDGSLDFIYSAYA